MYISSAAYIVTFTIIILLGIFVPLYYLVKNHRKKKYHLK